jgi:hypothetical protein
MVTSFGLEASVELKRVWVEAALGIVQAAGEARAGPPSAQLPDSLGSFAIGEAPRAGGIDAVLADVVRASETALETTASGYMAYIPGGGLFATAVADFIGDGLNRYTALAEAAPGLAAMERTVLSWLATEFGYGPLGCGLFTSGGSLATFTATTIARDQVIGETGDLRRPSAMRRTRPMRACLPHSGWLGCRSQTSVALQAIRNCGCDPTSCGGASARTERPACVPSSSSQPLARPIPAR